MQSSQTYCIGIAHDDGPQAFARGESGDEAALRRLVIDQHQQAFFLIVHDTPTNRPNAVQGCALAETGKDQIKPDIAPKRLAPAGNPARCGVGISPQQ